MLFAADTQESSLVLKRPTTKLQSLFGKKPETGKEWEMLVGSSGDILAADEAIDDIKYLLYKRIKPEEEKPSVSLVVLRKEIGNEAYAVYKKYKDRGDEGARFELLMGAADEYAKMLYVTSEGKTQFLDKFGIIGSGRVTGGELLLRELLEEDMKEREAAHLAALVIATVGHVDMYVGGRPDMLICTERTIYKYKKDDYEKILKTSELRWGLMKKAWLKMQKDKAIEKKLKEILEK